MNLGRGFSVPQEKTFIQNGTVWIPSTPDKPVLQRPIHPQAQMHQNETGPETWLDFVGLCTDYLGNGPSSNGVAQKFNTASYVDPVQRPSEYLYRSNVPMEQNHNIIDVETYNSRVTHNFNSSRNLIGQRIHNVTPVQNYNNRLTQNFCQTGIDVNSNPHTAAELLRPSSYVHTNIGSTVTTHRKVNSLTELMRSSANALLTNCEPRRNINSSREKPINLFPQRQVECNATTYISAGDSRRPVPILQSNYNSGDSRPQQLSNCASPVPCRTSYNLNLPPISEAGESSGAAAGPFQFGPVTPDQRNWSRNYTIQENSLLYSETVNQEKSFPKDGILSQQSVPVMQSNIGAAPAAISPLPNEKNNPDFVSIGGGIDLNKRPQTKPPKRKKYTPKVIREKKPKKTPKPAVQKNNTPEGTPTGKRKYVRRKGVNTSTPPSTDAATSDIRVCDVESSEKSCRRQLNFDLEKGVEMGTQGSEFIFRAQDNGKYKEKNTVPFNLNLESCEAEWSAKMDGNSGFSQKDVHQNIKHNSYQGSVPQATKNHLNTIARNLNARPTNGENRLDQIHHNLTGGLAHIAIQKNTNRPNLTGKRQHNASNTSETQEPMRDHTHAELAYSRSGSLMGAQLCSRGGFEVDQYLYHNNINLQQYPGCVKKSRVEDKYPGTSSRMNSGVTTDQDCSGPIESSRTNGLLCQNGPGKEMCISTHSDKVTRESYFNYRNHWHKFQQQNTLSQKHQTEKTGQSTSNILVGAHSMDSCTTVTHYHQNSAASKQSPPVTRGNDLPYPEIQVPTKGKIARKTPSKNSQASSAQVKVVPKKKKMFISVGDIIDGMKKLDINSTSGKVAVRREENAIVPYTGGEGTLAVFEPVKKRKPRPKVNLDPETNRLWNLLMGKEGGESTNNADANKEKWWEEERKVFRGRVDSFIARMHLVQGDRRFSKWKGSVVDSVIGVFLTQNVSDHLSSSAFMCLASKFPLKATSTGHSFCQNEETLSSSEKYKVHISFPDGTTSDDSSEINAVKERTTHVMNNPLRKEDDLFSSQGSSESFVFQACEDLRSSSGSNSEADDQFIGLNLNRSHLEVGGNSFHDKNPLITHKIGLTCVSNMHSYPSTSNMPPIPPLSDSWLNMSIGRETWNSDFPAVPGKESRSSLPNMDFGFISNSQARSDLRNGENLINFGLGGIHEVLQKERTFQADPKRPAHAASSKQPIGTGPCIDNQVAIDRNATIEPDKIGKVNSSSGEPSPSKKGNTRPNGRKRKAVKEKVEPFNWDSLREEVLLKCGKTNVTPLDSLDYEALRNADVGVISDTIKERGMNNMLAERMKDFLNRTVRDHGKIDLEWLRDVQPDTVKDYLLSIRGLGLKSVECLRLLTLHHSAFPVDTNVGRIAVRLGWVPLQPLPESLQLHLLEMYPMLESIQKYLWPRLCKLDQETLYELHYQMITFGKVFCTKREPNCNACPMRGECRHFASAFASARLALPGPEEKRVVKSSAVADQTNARDISPPEVIIKPVPLLPGWGGGYPEEGTSRNCEPIIEEPSTPEAHLEELERDIEDAFYEDPDEIPVIKLNIDEFTTNLQNFMQENMEMQEVDMSKALVALSPALASLPRPKLKNVNRLRTEHQVYELPDFHPLLEGWDRREADDPSPYLLAIWTPGETADSVKPPESNCNNREGGGGLCDVKTCFSCNTMRESQSKTVRGTILIPCRTAMRGSFPLNGTYFQVNELFADHESSLNPIDVPRHLLWNLPRRTVFFGTSASSIFKGLSTEAIQFCFWKGFVCVRGFDRENRAPRPLKARLHLAASKMEKPTDQKPTKKTPTTKKA